MPDKKAYPNVYHWFFFLKMFTPNVQATWGGKKHDHHHGQHGHHEHHKKEAKKETKKEDFDPFADDAPEEKKEAPKPAVVKKEKKPVIAKSIVIFDVKIEDTDTDLNKLAAKIYEITMDGYDIAYSVSSGIDNTKSWMSPMALRSCRSAVSLRTIRFSPTTSSKRLRAGRRFSPLTWSPCRKSDSISSHNQFTFLENRKRIFRFLKILITKLGNCFVGCAW